MGLFYLENIVKLTAQKLKQLIKEELAQQNMDAEVSNVDNSLMFRLKMLADHNRLSGEQKVDEILNVLQEAGLLTSDPRLSQS